MDVDGLEEVGRVEVVGRFLICFLLDGNGDMYVIVVVFIGKWI